MILGAYTGLVIVPFPSSKTKYSQFTRFNNEAKLALDQIFCFCKAGPKRIQLVLNNLTAFQNKAQEIRIYTIMHYKMT